MKYFLIASLLVSLNWNQTPEPDDKHYVYFFLSEDCVICQSYTLVLNELHDQYAGEDIEFIGVFPNFSSKPNKIEAFRTKYKIPFELKTDYFHSLVDQFQISVTPEVVIYHAAQDGVLYQGRIDNGFFRVGKRRRVTTTSELADALEAIKNKQKIKTTRTEPIGCILSKKKF